MQVALRVGTLGSELDYIKSSLDGKSKGRHDAIKVQVLHVALVQVLDLQSVASTYFLRGCLVECCPGIANAACCSRIARGHHGAPDHALNDACRDSFLALEICRSWTSEKAIHM